MLKWDCTEYCGSCLHRYKIEALDGYLCDKRRGIAVKKYWHKEITFIFPILITNWVKKWTRLICPYALETKVEIAAMNTIEPDKFKMICDLHFIQPKLKKSLMKVKRYKGSSSGIQRPIIDEARYIEVFDGIY